MVQETPRGEQCSGASTNRVSERAPASKRTFLAGPRIGRSASEPLTRNEHSRESLSNLPMTVKDAARFLGVSPQTVYLWVERKQIPHFRVMGRNIRFLRSDLRPFRAQFKQEVENGKTA
jgi:excisionase family DNA binding protein